MPTRTVPRKKRAAKSKARPVVAVHALASRAADPMLIGFVLAVLGISIWWFQSVYTVGLQSPFVVHLQWPVVITERQNSDIAHRARTDQNGRRLTAWQEYACRKFGKDCRLALAIQRAENPQGKCEIYHYNTNGTLDWGYFQINTVHLTRPGLNLRDLLDCKANVDFAYQLYRERGGFTPWSTYNSGLYKKFYSPD